MWNFQLLFGRQNFKIFFAGLFAFAGNKLQRMWVLVVSTNVTTTEYIIEPEHV